MIFQEFRDTFFEFGCFSSGQVHSWRDKFDKNNLGRWVKQGLLIRLKPGLYCFPEYKSRSRYELCIANKLYRPSYVSLHTALAFYGIIPEAVLQVTSVTTLKTAVFNNTFGHFSYQTVHTDFLFGYVPEPLTEGGNFLIAEPEKALADLLYLYPFYKSQKDMEDLRLDHDFMETGFNPGRMMEIVSRFSKKSLESRVKLLFKVYSL